MADEDLSLEKIKKLKVAELKARLSDVGLQVSGLKADLVARLCSYYESVPSEAPHIVKSEVDSQGAAPLAVGDTIQRDYDPPDSDHPTESSTEETSQLPAPVETPQTDTTQSDFLQTAVAPEAVTEISGRNDGAVPEAELEGNSNDEYVNSFSDQRVDDTVITKPSAPSQEESVLEEPKQNEPEPAPLVEPETMTWQGVSSSSEVSHVELKEQSNSLEENVPASKQGDAAEVTVEVGQVVDEMITDIDKRGEESTMETSSGIYEKEERLEQIKDAQINDREAELDTTTLAEVVPEASEPSMPVEETQSDEKEAMLESSIPVDNAQSKTSGSEKRLPDVPQIPYQTIPDKETSSAQQREMDNSGAHTEQTKDLQLPPNETPAVAIERNENDTRTQATYALGKAPRVDEVMKESNKVRSVDASGGKELSHVSQIGSRGDDSGYDVDQGEQEPPQEGSKKKKKKKKRKKKKDSEQAKVQDDASRDDEGIEVEYVADTPELDVRDPVYAQFAQIFETFKLTEKPEVAKGDDAKDKKNDQTTEAQKKDLNDQAMDTDSDEEEAEKQEAEAGEKVEKLSKKKLKLKNRMSVAELKQHVHRPDVVEMHDVTAPDPKLLVYLKACRNTVPVPRHWCFKRKFLQGKRGIIKPPFQLPEFIQKTGIMEMREALQEKEDAKNMKAKMREKVRPKMGKIDIDYQKLHDAFFKWQTKPKMTIHGDLYYEGKEFETKLKEKKPGDLSEELRTALGMPTGQGSNLVPPPWLIAMQRYGPPPSYPNLKIPGLNAPIPEGASFGYHAGGWGKPPVDEQGRPLYGDVFGVQQTDMNLMDDDQVDSTLWGELESESEESEESEEESEEEAADQSGLVTPAETGLVTPSGLTSIPAGMETPDMIELRKRKNIEEAMESGSEQPTLYTVLPEKRAGVGAMMMGSSHVYDLATAAPTGTKKTPGGLSEGVEVALDPSELELDPAAMQARYDEQLREQQSIQKEDFSDMVAEHAARQQKKRKKTTDSGKAAKKYKEFKF